MAEIEQFKLNGQYWLDISDPKAAEKLLALGFIDNGSGYFVPPSYLGNSASVRYSTDLTKWPETLMVLKGTEGEPHSLIVIDYPELVQKRYFNYIFEQSPRHFPEYSFSKVAPRYGTVFRQFQQARISTFQQWLDFPFKAEIDAPASYEMQSALYGKDIIAHFKAQQGHLQNVSDHLKGNIAEQLDYLDRYFHSGEFRPIQNKPATEMSDDDDLGVTPETHEVGDWRGLIFYELGQLVRSGSRISICQSPSCKGDMIIRPGQKLGRKFHTFEENPQCWRKRDALKRQRLRKQNKLKQ
jgi:hypothetical protein